MFTGLIEDIGTITSINQNNLSVSCNFANQLKIGDSVAVNGVCLTVTNITENGFSANLSNETLRVSNFSSKKSGDNVNLERAMLINSRLDGHLVYGHVDVTTQVLDIEKNNNFCTITFKTPEKSEHYIINKGSITIDGISLTIAYADSHYFKVAVIPHTQDLSTIKYIKIGQIVNIEFDVIAKYIEKKLSIYDNKSKISMEFLKENGFI